MEEKKNNLKKGIMEPGADFTRQLMQQVDAEEKALSRVLSRHGVEEPSVDFTAQLMKELEGSHPKAPYTPVISWKAWAGIAAAFIGVICLVLFGSDSGQTSQFSTQERLTDAADKVQSFFEGNMMIVYVVLGILLFSVGLLVEQRIQRKRSY